MTWDEEVGVDTTGGAELVNAASCVAEGFEVTDVVEEVDGVDNASEEAVEAVPLSLSPMFPFPSKKVPRLLAQHAASLLQQ